MLVVLILVNVENGNVFMKALLRLLKKRYYAFRKGIIMLFREALLRLLERRYYAFWKGVIIPF